MVLAFHLVLPTVVTLFMPHHGSFNVTDKGQTVDKSYFDSVSVRPHMITAAFLLFAIVFSLVKLCIPSYFDIQFGPTMLNIFWAGINLILLTAAICVGRETANKRKMQRMYIETPVNVYQASGTCSRTIMRDLSMSGCRVDGFKTPGADFDEDPITDIEILSDYTNVCVNVSRIHKEKEGDDFIRFSFENVDLDTRREFVRMLFSRADTWVRPDYKKDNPVRSFFTILSCIKDSLFGRRRSDDIHVAVVGSKNE